MANLEAVWRAFNGGKQMDLYLQIYFYLYIYLYMKKADPVSRCLYQEPLARSLTLFLSRARARPLSLARSLSRTLAHSLYLARTEHRARRVLTC